MKKSQVNFNNRHVRKYRRTMKKKTLTKAKKECWKAFSLYRRMKHCFETTGSIMWGFCFTCGKRYHIKLLQCGHFVSGRHNGNLFSEKGTSGQCYYCNISLKGNTLVYRRKLIEKYGEGIDIELEAEAASIIQYKVCDLENMTKEFKAKIKEMEEENKIK